MAKAEKSLIAVHFQRGGFARSGVSCLDLNGTAAAADAVNVIALVAGTAIIKFGPIPIKVLVLRAHPTRFERVTFAFGRECRE